MKESVDQAKLVARGLKADRRVRSACVLGSFARGQPDAFSDLDLLAVLDDHGGAVGRVKRAIPKTLGTHRVQLRLVTRTRLAELVERRTVFAAHVAHEGIVVFDRRGDLRKARRAFPAGSPVRETGHALSLNPP